MNNIFRKKRTRQADGIEIEDNFPNPTKKEIFTQGKVIEKALDKYIKADKICFQNIKIKIDKVKRIYIVGSGIDYSCALFTAYNLEVMTDKISCAVTDGEFIYSNPILDKGTLVILLSNNKAIEKRVKETKAQLLKVLCNCDEKAQISLDYETYGKFDSALYTLKLTVLSLLCLYLGEKSKVITSLYIKLATKSFKSLSKEIKHILSLEFMINELAGKLDFDNMVITGTNVDYAISIYAGKILSRFAQKDIPAVPLCELYSLSTGYTPLAFASNSDFLSILNTALDYQLIITANDIELENIPALIYDELIPLLNPILSSVAIQLIAYCKSNTEKENKDSSSD